MLMTLDKYMKDNDISDAKMAEKLGVTRQCVWYWRNGVKVPRDNTKKLIQSITDKSVDVSSWF